MQLWDLAAGKSIADLSHTHAITSVQLSPTELVLATACKDRQIRLWDLDTFETFDKSSPDTASATAMAFHPDGQSLFAAFPDSFRQYSLEPVTPVHHKLMAWNPATDLMVTSTSVICCSLSGTSATIWAGDSEQQASSAQQQKAGSAVAEPRRHSTATAEDGPGADVNNVADHLQRGAKISATPQTHGTWRNGQEQELRPAVVASADGGESSSAEPGSGKDVEKDGDTEGEVRQVCWQQPCHRLHTSRTSSRLWDSTHPPNPRSAGFRQALGLGLAPATSCYKQDDRHPGVAVLPSA